MVMSEFKDVMTKLEDYANRNEAVTGVKKYSVTIEDEKGNKLIHAGFGIAKNSSAKLFILQKFMEAVGNALFVVDYEDETIDKSAEHFEKYNKYWKKNLENVIKDLKDRSIGGNFYNYDHDGGIDGFYSLFKVSGYEDISIGE